MIPRPITPTALVIPHPPRGLEHALELAPLLVLGKKEAAERTVSIRRLGKEGQQVLPLDQALTMLADEAMPPDLKRAKAAKAPAPATAVA